jgi:superfamily I DNA and/or RNA helicase
VFFSDELLIFETILAEQCRALQALQKPRAAGGEPRSWTNLSLFAAQVIATTVDALLRLPDMCFDLVVFEEASQLPLTGLLKVLTKVVRARNKSQKLRLVLSGDPQQLPPVLKPLPECATKSELNRVRHLRTTRKRVERRPSLFAMTVQRHAPSVHTLLVQRRMHPEIAMLVSSLFYSGQRWQNTREDEKRFKKAVWWVDSGDSKPDPEPNGTSYSHKREQQIVESIGRGHDCQRGQLLVVTPYSAQAAAIKILVGEKTRVRTIDGCQGIEAEIVAVSFVQFTTDFVRDPRRVNVALSRARDCLYLIGNFKGLRDAAHATGLQHLLGMVAFFSKGGDFEARMVDAADRFVLPQ